MRTMFRVLLIAALVTPAISGAQQEQLLAPYLSTPNDVVERMLRLADVGPSDIVYDLGSGDGRIVIAAAKMFGARGVGIEIDAGLISKAEDAAKAAGVADRVS